MIHGIDKTVKISALSFDADMTLWDLKKVMSLASSRRQVLQDGTGAERMDGKVPGDGSMPR